MLVLAVLSGATYAEFDQRVPTKICTLTFAADCFEQQQGKVYQVSKEALYLSDLYYFCLQIDTLKKSLKPIQVILAIDETSSMCNSKTWEHNDVNDQRILASHLFLDSLVQRSPMSRLGTVRFNRNFTMGPFAINNAANVTELHEEISRAACNSDYTYPKRRALRKTSKALATSIGAALNVALIQADFEYEAIFDSHDRHIILLTDGQWDDRGSLGPQRLLNDYAARNPGREPPKIHGVFLSDSALHVQHGHPAFPYGAEMQQIVQQTGGVFIPNAQPHNIVQNLLAILDSISVHVPEELESVSFTNVATGETRQTTFEKLPAETNRWEVRLPAFELQYGLNQFVITKQISGNVSRDTLRINRATTTLQNPDLGQFSISCRLDTVHLDIKGTPDVSLANAYIPVTARVRPEEANRFTPGDVTLRAFTQYTDNHPNTAALFHLENNVLNAVGGQGAGAPSFSQNEFAFGEYSLGTNQTFQFTMPAGLTTANFTAEAWVKLNYNAQGTLFDGEQFDLSIDAGGHVVLASNFASITTQYEVDRNVWQHIAVAGTGSAIKIFVNGLEVASQPATVATALSGAVTVGPLGGYVDEVRLGSALQTQTVGPATVLSIPTAQTVNWEVNGGAIAAPTATLPGTLWPDGTPGQTEFKVTSSGHASIIVNLLHTGQGVQWSKNSNPLLFYIKYASLVIEADPTGQQSPYKPNPIGTLRITQYETEKSVYAVLRDSRGHFVEASPITNWSSSDPSVVGIAAGDQTRGEGVVSKHADDATAVVTAVNPTHNLSNTVTVEVLGYYWKALRIVNPANTAIDSLVMDTDQDTLIKVQGLRSDNDQWEDASAIWQLNPIDPVTQTLTPPGEAGTWPIALGTADTGAGWIRVTTNNDFRTTPDSIWYDFSPAPPSQIDITIITPDAQRRAGDTITAVVNIRNKDGLMPGTYCRDAAYNDKLGDGGRPAPIIIVDDNQQPLNTGGSTANAGQQCFEQGVDTVKFVLYYAPVSQDSFHQISVNFDGLQASSQEFHLHPGDLASLKIEDYAGNEVVGPVKLTFPDGAVTLYSRGYDAWGNKIPGDQAANWSAEGTLHPIENPNNTPQIFYTAERAPNSESGTIQAAAVSNAAISDDVPIEITGPKSQLVTATTRDFNGNGYLDAIELQFSKNITFPSSNYAQHMTIRYNSVYFEIDSVSPSPGAASNFFTVHLKEYTIQESPQTDWLPKITLDGIDELASVSGQECIDGAGPVIWSVTKKVNDASDATKDLVRVTFSERVQQDDGSPLASSMTPQSMFNVWISDGKGGFAPDTAVLSGIKALSLPGNTFVEFYMENGQSLEGHHLVSIRTDPEALADAGGVSPVDENQKVRVVVIGNIGDIVIGPNPMVPTSDHAEEVLLYHEPYEAYQWAKTAGAAITVDLTLNNNRLAGEQDQVNTVSGLLMVFDAVGNLVYTRENDNVLPEKWRTSEFDSSRVKLVFYWNGMTDQNMKAAPGLYRVIVFLDTGREKSKYRGNVGISR